MSHFKWDDGWGIVAIIVGVGLPTIGVCVTSAKNKRAAKKAQKMEAIRASAEQSFWAKFRSNALRSSVDDIASKNDRFWNRGGK